MNFTSTTPGPPPVVLGIPNTLYYLRTEPLIFKVDGQIFKVPSYRFLESEIFCATYNPTTQPNGIRVGTDENPIVLDGLISALHFQGFLQILYPLKKPTDFSKKPAAEWKAIFKLSTIWGYPEIRRYASKHLTPFISPPKNKHGKPILRNSNSNNNDGITPLPTLEKILYARECRIGSWLIDGYDEFVHRMKPITIEEARVLGLETTVLLAKERDVCRSEKHTPEHYFGDELGHVEPPICSHVQGLKMLFKEELEGMVD